MPLKTRRLAFLLFYKKIKRDKFNSDKNFPDRYRNPRNKKNKLGTP